MLNLGYSVFAATEGAETHAITSEENARGGSTENNKKVFIFTYLE